MRFLTSRSLYMQVMTLAGLPMVQAVKKELQATDKLHRKESKTTKKLKTELEKTKANSNDIVSFTYQEQARGTPCPYFAYKTLTL